MPEKNQTENPAAKPPAGEKRPAAKSSGTFKVLSDLKFNQKRYKPGETVNLKGLNKVQVERLKKNKVIV